MSKIKLLLLIVIIGSKAMAWDTPGFTSPADDASIWIGTKLNWQAVSGSEFYEVQVDTSSSFDSPHFQQKTEPYINSSSSNTDTEEYFDFYFGKTYYWRVRAWVTGDTSAWSTIRTFETRDYVSKDDPVDDADIWTGTTFDWFSHAGVSFYHVQVDTSLSFDSPALREDVEAYINSSSSNVDTYEFFDDLYFGKTYYWRVRAYSELDTSAWGTVYTVYTRDYVTKDDPVDDADIWTGSEFDWYAHHGVDFYHVQIDTSLAFDSPAMQEDVNAYINTSSFNNDTRHFFDDLYFGKTYYWRVRAINAVDTSEWGTLYTVYTRDYVTKDDPVDDADIWTGSEFDWYAHHGVDFYHVQIDTSLTFDSPAMQEDVNAYINTSSFNNDTRHFFDDLYFGKTYYWRVRAINAVDTSDWGTLYTVYTRDYVTKDDPVDDADIWTGSEFDWYAHHGVDLYHVQIDTSLAFDSPALQEDVNAYISSSSFNPDTRHFFDDLYFGKTYYWRVRAINAVDTSDWGIPYNVHTRDYVTLTSPSDFYTDASTSGVTLNWNSHHGVDFYQMQFDTTNLYNSALLVNNHEAYISSSSSNPDTNHPTGDLLDNQVYFWRVRAINAVDTSAWRERVFTTGESIIIPDEPTLIYPADNAVDIPVLIDFEWAGGSSEYEIQFAPEGDFPGTTFTTSISEFTSPELDNETTYLWRVRSKNGGIYSDWTAIWEFTTACEPSTSTVVASSCTAYTSPSGDFTWTESGTYTDIIPSASGCDSIITIELTIHTIDLTVIAGTYLLEAQMEDALYQWVDCDNDYAPIEDATGRVFNPEENGNYAVIITYESCSDTSACNTITALSIENHTQNNPIRIYPNPTQGVITISELTDPEKTTIKVYDALGAIVPAVIQTTDAAIHIELTGENGIYFITLLTEDQPIQTTRVIKQ